MIKWLLEKFGLEFKKKPAMCFDVHAGWRDVGPVVMQNVRVGDMSIDEYGNKYIYVYGQAGYDWKGR